MNNRLKNRLLGGLVVVAAALAAAAVASLAGAAGARRAAASATRLAEARALAGDALRATYELELAAVQFVRTGDDDHAKRFESALAEARVILTRLAAASDDELQKNRVSTAAPLLEDWAKTGGGAQVDARRRMKETRVGTLVDPAKGDKKLRDLRTLLVEYAGDAEKAGAAATAAASGAFSVLNLLILLGLALGLAADGGVGFHQIKTVVRPVSAVRDWLADIRAGKAANLDIPGGDEIGDLADSFKSMESAMLSARRESESLLVHPDASPHPVMTLKSSGEVISANAAAKALAAKVQLDPAGLLPPDAAKVVEAIAGNEGHARRERAFGDARYDFLFKGGASASDPVFVVALERVRRLPTKSA